MQDSQASSRRWPLAVVLVAVAAAAPLIHWPVGCDEPTLHLNPYVAPPMPPTWLGRFEPPIGPVGAAVTLGLVAASLGLLAWVGRADGHGRAASAALAMCAFAAVPATQTFVHGIGQQFAAVALLCAAVGALGTVASTRFGWIAAGLCSGLATALHPLGILAAPTIIVGSLFLSTLRARCLGVLATVVGVAFAHWRLGPPWPLVPLPGLEAVAYPTALRQLAAIPALLIDPRSRALLPTGFEALKGSLPVTIGSIGWLLALALTWRAVGLGRTLSLALATAAVGVAIPWLIPRWIPADPAVSVLLGVPWIVAAAVGLVRWLPVRLASLGLGLAVGLLAIGFLSERERRPSLTHRRLAFQIPRVTAEHGGHRLDIFAPHLEADPARLALYLVDARFDDPHTWTVEQARNQRLDAGEPAVDRARLEILRLGGVLPDPKASNEQIELIRRIPSLSTAVMELTARWSRILDEDKKVILESIVDEATLLSLDALEFHVALPEHPGVRPVLDALGLFVSGELLRHLARLGDVHAMIPLREVLTEIGPEPDVQRALLARHLFEVGRLDEALEQARIAQGRVPVSDDRHALALAISGLTKAARGDDASAFVDLQAAWSRLARSMETWSDSDESYWFLVEVLVVRAEIAARLRSDFLNQARADVRRKLERSLLVGRRRLPSLWLGARFDAHLGNLESALALAREGRQLTTSSFAERGDGPAGRLDYPRYQIAVRRLLLTLGEEDPESLEAEIARIETKSLQ